MFVLSSAHFHLVDNLCRILTFLRPISSHPERLFIRKNETSLPFLVSERDLSYQLLSQVYSSVLDIAAVKKDFTEHEIIFDFQLDMSDFTVQRECCRAFCVP